jgi:hypothetical protein
MACDASPRHQLSYTLAALHSGDQPGSGGGFGDVILNYRYQVLGNGESKVAFAPRFSVFFPTGDSRLGRGTGGAGVQGLLPLSVLLTRKLVTHWNAGTTIIPKAKILSEKQERPSVTTSARALCGWRTLASMCYSKQFSTALNK